MIEQGAFYSVRRVGTFVGPPPVEGPGKTERELYLMIADIEGSWSHVAQMRMGFENRIAHLGGAVATLDLAQTRAQRAKVGELHIAGVFELSETLGLPADCDMARVCYGRVHPWSAGADTLSFDDFDGGVQATRCLLEAGARRLAFVGMHARDAAAGDWPDWSYERQRGFSGELGGAGLNAELTFHPAPGVIELSVAGQLRMAQDVAREFVLALRNGLHCEGAVAANDEVARAVLNTLRLANIAPERWPALVGFDCEPTINDQLLTSLRLGWDEVGRRAADLLWERRNGRLPAAPQHVAVKMRLISRLSCQPQWMSQSHFEAPALAL